MMALFSRKTRLLLLVLLSMSVVACGFQLRGQHSIPNTLYSITLSSESGVEEFDRSLRLALKESGIKVIDQEDASQTTLNLKVNKISSSNLELARDSSNDVSQVQRTLSSHYFVRQADGKSVYGPRHISTSRTLTNQNDDASVTLSYNTAQLREMYDDLATALMNDLAYAPL